MNDFFVLNVMNSILMIMILCSRKLITKYRNDKYIFVMWGILIISLLLPFQFSITRYVLNSNSPILYSSKVFERTITNSYIFSNFESSKTTMNYLVTIYFLGVILFLIILLSSNLKL